MESYGYAEPWIAPEHESPRRLIRSALLWLALCRVMAVALPMAYGIVVGFHNAHALDRWEIDRPIAGLLTALGLGGALVIATLLRGRSVGHGSLMDGLAFYPIERPGLLIFLTLACMAVPGFLSLVLIAAMQSETGFVLVDRLHQAWGDTPPVTLTSVILTVVVAPITEELFFRGWFWTGLSRSWGPRSVFFTTAIPFLLMHLPGGLFRPLTLIPATLFISLARHACGGTRASILVHAMNNLAAVGLMLVIHRMVR